MLEMTFQDNFKESYSKLNPEQQQAVDTIDGPLMVVAGPGSGKTQLLSMRVANILHLTDTPPDSILCLTFTESAALNMRKRLRSIIGQEANRVAIHTFHSFGSELINHNPEYFFFGRGFNPADELASIAILQEILTGLPSQDPLTSFHPEHGWTYIRDIQARITDLKKAGLSPEDFLQIIDQNRDFLVLASPIIQEYFATYQRTDLARNWSELINKINHLPDKSHSEYDLKRELLRDLALVEIQIKAEAKPSSKPITAWKNRRCRKNDQNQLVLKTWANQEKYENLAKIYKSYQNKLHSRELYDFDDMLLEVLHAFQRYPSLRYTYQEQFLYILVDEFQDTSGVQTKLLENLANSEISNNRPNLMVVGDDDQAIFKFQGASLDNLLKFKAKYKEVSVISLNKNYRSKQIVLDLAAKVIENCQRRLSSEEGLNKSIVSQV